MKGLHSAVRANLQVAKDEETFITLMNWGIFLSLVVFLYYFDIQIPTDGSPAIKSCKASFLAACAGSAVRAK